MAAHSPSGSCSSLGLQNVPAFLCVGISVVAGGGWLFELQERSSGTVWTLALWSGLLEGEAGWAGADFQCEH